MIKKILVPVDGSSTARKAAAYAYELAGQVEASVTLISVIDRSVFVGRPAVPASETPTEIVEPLEDFLRQWAEADMEEIEAIGAERGVKTKMVIRFGHPAEEIVGEAERTEMDLIIMGSHGRSALQAALIGSVTYGVIHRDSRVPVLVVRR
jgi:nucleotide-binding universal stress UspA family protein